jgi:glyoxylase-like metal-dependent hydrolase (beta-lactamase superfamily II)
MSVFFLYNELYKGGFVMIIRHLNGNLYEADFDNNPHYIRQVIYFITEGKRILLIDTGYQDEMKQLMTYFYDRSMYIDKIIISHYHDDHFMGLKVLQENTDAITIIGSSEFKRTLELEYSHDFLHDTNIYPTIFSDGYNFYFGGHRIRFEKAPGHSQCSIHTLIDDSYIHVADNVMFDTNNKSMLPLPYFSIQEHINTLEKLKKHLGKHIIGSHFSNELNLLKDMETEINERIAYLKIMQKSSKKADYFIPPAIPQILSAF